MNGSTDLGAVTVHVTRDGFNDNVPQHEAGYDCFTGAPVEHPEYGLTTEQLADSQKRFTEYARSRIERQGHWDYSRGDTQAFEDMTVERILLELRDEIADSVNYLTFLDINIDRWLRTLRKVEG